MGNKGFLYQTIIHATADRVWKALTTPEFTVQYWFGRRVESDWRVGSEVKIITPDGKVEVKGKILTADVNKRLSYTWGSGTDTDNTTVVFDIIQMGPLVKLLITHDIDMDAHSAEQTMNGWTFIASGIKTLLETGSPMPALAWKK
jgi:uncharacterized protein YndB with AHSA1/START domain